MSSFKIIICLIIGIYSLNISSFNINFFEQRTKLYYVNAINNENGDIYFEFWGEDDAMRYYIGKNYSTEENINIYGNEIYSINANSNWNYHESIIINYNDNINILSMNSKNFDYINLKDMSISYEATTSLIGSHSGDPSYRSCIIKLLNGNYLSSIILHGSSHQIYLTIFNITSNDINDFETIKQIQKTIGYMNSTSCFQTESTYIQCSFSNVLPSNYFTVGIYDLNFNEKATKHFGYLLDYTFTKIFHIKGEIGAYIFFDDRANNVPKLFLKQLNGNKNGLNNLFSSVDYIVLDNGGTYILNYGLFSSDAIKINDKEFAVILTISNSFDLLICLCDFNDDYTAIRIRYYYLDLSTINIKITVNLRAFNFKNNFGLIFYDSTSEYPGYIFFNYPSIISENKVDSRTIKINILENSSSSSFYFPEHLKLINKIYEGPIKIKIIDFSSSNSSGVIIKSSDSELSEGDIINFEEHLIFESNITGAIPGVYCLEFSPFVDEIESSTQIYGDYQEDDFKSIGSFSNAIFNLIYIVKCHENCISCDEGDFIYRKNQDVNYCLSSCEYNNKKLYKDENENICYNNCSEATNGNIYLYVDQCKAHCPENYTPNENNICIFNEVISVNAITNSIITNNLLIIETSKINSVNIISESIIADNLQIIKTSELNNYDYTNKQEINEFNSEKQMSDILLPSYYIIESNNETMKPTNKLINDSDNILNECYIDVDSLIDDYKKNGKTIEIKELEKCSMIYYCYSTNSEMGLLISINPKLIYMDFNTCKNSLIKKQIIEENSQLLIIGKQLIDDFEYEIYRTNGTKIKDLSICDNTKIEMTSPINDEEDIQIAISLYDQGYDIFNLNSSFYYDICLSAYLNDSDLTLSIRQNDIIPTDKSVCYDGCFYNGVNLTTKRISCLCDFDYFEKNVSTKEKQIEEVDENFFSYILDMINYKIIICHKLFFNFQNYFNNYGFYAGIGILFIILILCIAYLCIGKKSIKIQYLNQANKFNKKIENLQPSINNISSTINQRNSQEILIPKISTNMIQTRRKSKKSKTIKKNNTKSQSNPPKYKVNEVKNINNKNSRKRNTTKEINKFNINVNNILEYENSYENIIKAMKNDNNNGTNLKNEQKNESLDYNEMTYSQAIVKDERNIIQIFFSYFNGKFEIVQIIFYPKAFSHKSLTFSLYLFELLLDLTFNALLFSDDIISQKYYNNGELLFITSQILSISSNVISCFLVYITSYLINYYPVFETATLEAKIPNKFYKIFINIFWFINLKISFFFINILSSGLFCSYYLFIFCSIFKKIQKNLFMNYLIGTLWSLIYKVGFSLLTTILRKIAICGKYKKLYFISKYIDENF